MTTPICTHTLSKVQIVQADNRPRGSYQPLTFVNPDKLYNNVFPSLPQDVNQQLPYPISGNTYSTSDA